MAHSFGEGETKRAMLQVRKVGADELRVGVARPWEQIRAITAKRRAVAEVVLEALLAKLPGVHPERRSRSSSARRASSRGDQADIELAAQVEDPAGALEQALLYLHENRRRRSWTRAARFSGRR